MSDQALGIVPQYGHPSLGFPYGKDYWLNLLLYLNQMTICFCLLAGAFVIP